MSPGLVLILAIPIIIVLVVSTFALMVHWAGYQSVLFGFFLPFAVAVAVFARKWLWQGICASGHFCGGIFRNKERSGYARPLSKTYQSQERTRHIPSEVKRDVWRRDNGCCTQCGSNEFLEYDHIVPFSRGGANTARNIQMLCQPCNRSKSDKIE